MVTNKQVMSKLEKWAQARESFMHPRALPMDPEQVLLNQTGKGDPSGAKLDNANITRIISEMCGRGAVVDGMFIRLTPWMQRHLSSRLWGVPKIKPDSCAIGRALDRVREAFVWNGIINTHSTRLNPVERNEFGRLKII